MGFIGGLPVEFLVSTSGAVVCFTFATPSSLQERADIRFCLGGRFDSLWTYNGGFSFFTEGPIFVAEVKDCTKILRCFMSSQHLLHFL